MGNFDGTTSGNNRHDEQEEKHMDSKRNSNNDTDNAKEGKAPLVEVHGDAYDNLIVEGDINAPFTITNRREA